MLPKVAHVVVGEAVDLTSPSSDVYAPFHSTN